MMERKKECRTGNLQISVSQCVLHYNNYYFFINFDQIIVPLGLATAYFAIPETAIPFTISSSSFLITVVIIAVGLRLARMCTMFSFKITWSTISRRWEELTAARTTTLPVSEVSTDEIG